MDLIIRRAALADSRDLVDIGIEGGRLKEARAIGEFDGLLWIKIQ